MNFLGIAEASIIASYKQNSNKSNSCGYLAKNIQLQIRDVNERKKSLSPNLLGEIWYKLMCKWCNPKTCELPHCYNYKAKENTIDLRACIAGQYNDFS